MSVMNLSVSSFPFSVNGVAGIDLMVSVTNAQGVPYTGLSKGDFQVRWIDNISIDEPIKATDFKEYTAANGLPELPGVYVIELTSERASWSQITTFYIAVTEFEKGDHGQLLYRIDDSSFRQMNP